MKSSIKMLMKKYGEVDIMCCTRDRHSEVALMIETLRKQTYTKWNLLLLDDASGTPLTKNYFVMSLINRIRLEGHKIKVLRNNISYGVCAARNLLIKTQLNFTNNELCLRADDDVLFENDYIERLVNVIDSGYDMASGVIPVTANPQLKREVRFVGGIINKHVIDEKGDLVSNNDDCGYCYLDEKILPTHQFRTHALYKKQVHEKVKYPTNLTTVGFREEGFFSFGAIIEGFTIGVDVNAIAYHFVTPSGGVRCQNYNENVALDDETFKKWIKIQFEKHGNFLQKYNEKVLNNDKRNKK